MKVFIAGTGTMGIGIAQVFAQAGHDVLLHHHSSPEKAQAGIEKIGKVLSRLVERGKMNAYVKDEAISNIHTAKALGCAVECDIVIETITENIEAKKHLFAQLDNICTPDAIFATNTSSLSITEIAAATSRPDKVIGLHFFNPAPLMKLVEIVRGLKTSEHTFATIFDLCRGLDKESIEVKETPGFLVNKLLIPMINDAINTLDDGIVTAEAIDTAMRLGAGHPMGPLALSDFIGNDIVLDILNTLWHETGEQRYRPALLLKKMVHAGHLGKKVGKGFYSY